MVRGDVWLRKNAKRLGIDPGLVGPASVDVRLGGSIIVYDDEREVEEEVGQYYVLRPGLFYLAHTIEYVRVPEDHAALLVLRSTWARKGLGHANAGWIDPGFQGQITMELYAHRRVVVREGEPIAQLVFFAVDFVEKDYSKAGRYQGQTGVTPAKT